MAKCPFCDHVNRTNATECEKCRAPLQTSIPSRTEAAQQAEEPAQEAAPEPGSLEADILRLMRGGKKIEAIKLYRARTRVGLKEAKDFVEALAAKHGIAPSAGGCAGAVLFLLIIGATAVGAACTLIL